MSVTGTQKFRPGAAKRDDPYRVLHWMTEGLWESSEKDICQLTSLNGWMHE